MTYYVSSGALNPTHSLTHVLVHDAFRFIALCHSFAKRSEVAVEDQKCRRWWRLQSRVLTASLRSSRHRTSLWTWRHHRARTSWNNCIFSAIIRSLVFVEVILLLLTVCCICSVFYYLTFFRCCIINKLCVCVCVFTYVCVCVCRYVWPINAVVSSFLYLRLLSHGLYLCRL